MIDFGLKRAGLNETFARVSFCILGLMLPALTTAGPYVASDFQNGTEGWEARHYLRSSDGSTLVLPRSLVYSAPTTASVGFISESNIGDEAWWFYAPQKFKGDLGYSYGLTMSFALSTSVQGGFKPPRRGEVVVVGGGMSLGRTLDERPATDGSWVDYSFDFGGVGFSDDAWYRDDGYGALAEVEEMKAVLSDVTGIYIIGDFASGAVGATSLRMFAINHALPEPPSLLLSLLALTQIGILALAQRRRT